MLLNWKVLWNANRLMKIQYWTIKRRVLVTRSHILVINGKHSTLADGLSKIIIFLYTKKVAFVCCFCQSSCGWQQQLSLVKTDCIDRRSMHSFRSFDDFCQDTSLHGWAHFNQPKNSKTARLVWFLIILGSFSVAFYLNER